MVQIQWIETGENDDERETDMKNRQQWKEDISTLMKIERIN